MVIQNLWDRATTSSSLKSPLLLTTKPAGRQGSELKGRCSNTNANFTSLSEEIIESELMETIASPKPQELDSEVGGLLQPYALL